MAVKPPGNPDIFAPDANFPAGGDPWSGQPNKVTPTNYLTFGFLPNTGIRAEDHDFMYNLLTTWVRWVSFGSFNPLEEAHIVEADEEGDVQIASLRLGGTGAGLPGLRVFSNSSSRAVDISHTGSGAALEVDSTVGVAVDVGFTGVGFAVEVESDDAGIEVVAGALGLSVTTTGANAVEVSGGTDTTMTITAGTGGKGLEVTAGVGVGSSNVIRAVGPAGAGGDTILGLSANDAAAVRGVAALNGYGGRFEGVNNNPQRASMLIGTQNTEPVIGEDGAFYIDEGDLLTDPAIRYYYNSWFTAHATNFGYVVDQFESLGFAAFVLEGIPEIVGGVSVQVPNLLDTLVINFTFRAQNPVGQTWDFTVELWDIFANVAHSTQSYLGGTNIDDLSGWRSFNGGATFSPVGTGQRLYGLRFLLNGNPGDLMPVLDVVITVVGSA